MAYKEEPYDHFHVVAICVECAEIQIIGLASDTEALTKFFNQVDSDLREAAKGPYAPRKDVQFDVQVIVPNQIMKITPLDGHTVGHVSVCVAHKCTDPYDFCYQMQKTLAIGKVAAAMAASILNMSNPDFMGSSDNKTEEQSNDVARHLLESLDLPEDLFKGFH